MLPPHRFGTSRERSPLKRYNTDEEMDRAKKRRVLAEERCATARAELDEQMSKQENEATRIAAVKAMAAEAVAKIKAKIAAKKAQPAAAAVAKMKAMSAKAKDRQKAAVMATKNSKWRQ